LNDFPLNPGGNPAAFRHGERLRSGIVELVGADRDYSGLEERVYRKTRIRISRQRIKRLVERSKGAPLSLEEFEALEEVAVQEGSAGCFFRARASCAKSRWRGESVS